MNPDIPEENPAPDKEVEVDPGIEKEEINLDPQRETGNDDGEESN